VDDAIIARRDAEGETRVALRRGGIEASLHGGDMDWGEPDGAGPRRLTEALLDALLGERGDTVDERRAAVRGEVLQLLGRQPPDGFELPLERILEILRRHDLEPV
jgi:hypothetical protein